MTLRIGIDAHIVGAGKGGVERFLRELCAQLPRLEPACRYIIFCSQKALAAGEFGAPPAHVDLIAMPFSNPLLERAFVLPWLARRHNLDVLLVQRLAPWAMGTCRVVLTVHDITPMKFPRQYRGLTNTLVRLLTASSVRRSVCVLTPCITIGGEVATYSGEPIGKFKPYFNGVDTSVFRPVHSDAERSAIIRRLQLKSAYVLTSGALERRKNIETMLRMMPRLAPDRCAELVVVGGTRDGVYASELAVLAESHALRGRVRFMGFVPENDLADLYRAATVFVTASRDEGFNMPVLEALASGVPSVCSDIAVHRELFSGATSFFSPDDDLMLADHVCRILTNTDLGDQMVTEGLLRARQFNWTAAAQRVGSVLVEAATRTNSPE